MFGRVQRAIQSADLDFGYELVEEDWDLKYPVPDPQLALAEQMAIDQARLYTFYAAWLMDEQGNKAARSEIAGIKVAVLDTGFALGHPDFVGRAVTSATFVGQPVQDLHGHGTHCIGTSCGPKAPAGTTPRPPACRGRTCARPTTP